MPYIASLCRSKSFPSLANITFTICTCPVYLRYASHCKRRWSSPCSGFASRNCTPFSPSISTHFNSSTSPFFARVFAPSKYALILASIGNSSDIGEMLTISDAAPSPGDRQVNVFDSCCVSVQPGGTVNDIPCLSHFASGPPPIAAACAAVGCATSGFDSFSLTPPELELEAPEPPLCNRSERLQSDNAKPINNTSANCFINGLLN